LEKSAANAARQPLEDPKGFGVVQPFGIRNDLSSPVTIVVGNVDPYDWVTGSEIGMPSYSPPLGFNGVTLESGKSVFSWFMPKANANGAPFLLEFRNSVGNVITSLEFDRAYECYIAFGAPAPCSWLTSKEWVSWGFRDRVDGRYLDQQVPAICGSVSPSFTAPGGAKSRGRLECGSMSGGSGTAIVLEKAP